MMELDDDCPIGPGVGFTVGNLIPEDEVSARPHFGKYEVWAQPWIRLRATAGELGRFG